MAAQPIDFSSGLVSAAPAQSAGVDYSAGLVAQPGPAPSQAGAQRQPQDLEAQVDPAHPEGVYKMNSPQGKLRHIPYSNVGLALQQGHLFADKGGLQQYARDHAADPLSEDRIDKFLSLHPEVNALIPGGGERLPVIKGAYDALKGVGTGAAKTWTAFDKTPTSRLETDLQLAAATPSNTLPEQAGEAGENVGEFFTGEELLSLLGKGAAALPMAAKLKAMTGVAEMLQKSSVLAKLAKIGSVTVKQGTVGAGQTFMKTGGDASAAMESGRLTAVMAGAGGALYEGGSALANRAGAGARATEAASNAYSEAAQAAVKPHLEALNAASEPVTTAQAGPGGPHDFVFRQQTTTPVPKIDVQDAMTKIGDFTAGRQVLKDEMSAAYDHFDKLTGGEFRKANAAVQAADEAAASGDSQKIGDYVEAQNRMDALLDSTKGSATPEMIAAVKAGFRKYYVLGGVARALDKATDGLPGASAVSQEQRGINGKKLLNGLSNLVIQHGRPAVESALGGPGRLEAMEAIGNATKTNAGRAAVNKGMLTVAGYLLGAKVGWSATGNWTGGVMGGMAGERAAMLSQQAVGKVMKAVTANPAVAHLLLFAIDAGANPENYGPFIATRIQQSETEASRERQAKQAQKGDGKQ